MIRCYNIFIDGYYGFFGLCASLRSDVYVRCYSDYEFSVSCAFSG